MIRDYESKYFYFCGLLWVFLCEPLYGHFFFFNILWALEKKIYGILILSESQSSQNGLQDHMWPGPPLLLWFHLLLYTPSVTSHFMNMPDTFLIRLLHLLFPLPGTLFARICVVSLSPPSNFHSNVMTIRHFFKAFFNI